jgi:hypothetical protein
MNLFICFFQDVKGRISFGIDGWTSPGRKYSFIAITAHWISNEWVLENTLLDFVETPSHSGENICNVFVQVLIEFNISKKVFIFIFNLFIFIFRICFNFFLFRFFQ